MTQCPKEIFREYDIRGIVHEQLTPAFAMLLGKAVGTQVILSGGTKVVVGRDHRLSGEALEKGLCEGLRAVGCAVTRIGVVPTPVLYWAIENLKSDGGIQITGSHNPPEYNGFKLTLLGRSLFGDDIQALYQLIINQDFLQPSTLGASDQKEVLQSYIDDLATRLNPCERKFKVVVDAGNGTGGITALPLYKKLGYEVVPLYCEPDGEFPNHHPDPTVESNLEDLRREVLVKQADIGIAFDGDADRIGVIDRDGEVIWGDMLLLLFARELLKEHPGAAIIGEVKCSKNLYDDIKKRGGKGVMAKAGHSIIKAKMKELGALLAGEMSGHIFFKHRYYGFDDGVYAGARLLELLVESKQTVTEMLSDLPQTSSTPEIRVDCPDNLKTAVVAHVTRRFKSRADTEGFRVIDTDGARVEWDDGWGLVRQSNTQPLLVMRFEADCHERVHTLRALFEAEISTARKELEG